MCVCVRTDCNFRQTERADTVHSAAPARVAAGRRVDSPSPIRGSRRSRPKGPHPVRLEARRKPSRRCAWCVVVKREKRKLSTGGHCLTNDRTDHTGNNRAQTRPRKHNNMYPSLTKSHRLAQTRPVACCSLLVLGRCVATRRARVFSIPSSANVGNGMEPGRCALRTALALGSI